MTSFKLDAYLNNLFKIQFYFNLTNYANNNYGNDGKRKNENIMKIKIIFK